MAEKLSVYLTDSAIAELDALANVLSELVGIPISRSATLCSLIENQASVYLEARLRLAQIVEKYRPEPATAGQAGDDGDGDER